MHFLMPNVFHSHREFKEWFSNPVTGMIEGNSEYNENIIKRLHKVSLRKLCWLFTHIYIYISIRIYVMIITVLKALNDSFEAFV